MNNKDLINQLQDCGVSKLCVRACNLAAERLASLDKAEYLIRWLHLELCQFSVPDLPACVAARELLKEMEKSNA